MATKSQTADSSRQARIAAIRREIAAGTYETPEKLEAALAAFLAGAREEETRIVDDEDTVSDARSRRQPR